MPADGVGELIPSARAEVEGAGRRCGCWAQHSHPGRESPGAREVMVSQTAVNSGGEGLPGTMNGEAA